MDWMNAADFRTEWDEKFVVKLSKSGRAIDFP